MNIESAEFVVECNKTIAKVQALLAEHTEWHDRYLTYANEIHENLDVITEKKKKFHEWKPLHLYMNVLEAKTKMCFSLRYLGQDVAKLKISHKGNIISTKDFDAKNEKYFDCPVALDNSEWVSKDASNFRRHFAGRGERVDSSGKKNEEHRIESVLLSEFSKKSGLNKRLHHIQPVTIAGVARFQMPTPLSASNLKSLKYSGHSGGGIDIISRIGKSTKLCIMEVKDENKKNEPAATAVQQGLAYATFIRELLGSKGGEKWWKIFGFTGKLPKKLDIYVASVMPSIENNDTTFANTVIKTPTGDFHMHYLYFKEKGNEITDILTSLPQCMMNPQAPLQAD